MCQDMRQARFKHAPIKQAALQAHALPTVTALTTGSYFTWTVCTFDLKDSEAFQNMTLCLHNVTATDSNLKTIT